MKKIVQSQNIFQNQQISMNYFQGDTQPVLKKKKKKESETSSLRAFLGSQQNGAERTDFPYSPFPTHAEPPLLPASFPWVDTVDDPPLTRHNPPKSRAYTQAHS